MVMGILNLTPDSFSDGGRFIDPDRAVERALAVEAAGADLLDIGGESTRPGAEPVPVAEEEARVIPVLERLRDRLRIPISIDTTRSRVARRAIEAGAEIINDVSGLRADVGLADIAAATGAALVLMHSRGNPQTMQELPPMVDLFPEVIAGLSDSVAIALGRGVAREKLIIDPGIGFGKLAVQNLELIGGLNRLADGLAERVGMPSPPILLGASRKSFIKLTLDRKLVGIERDGAGERLAGSLASMVLGILRGARIVRVHDVAEAVAAVRLTEAIISAGRGAEKTDG